MGVPTTVWDYPTSRKPVVLDQVLRRYIEAIIFQAVAENMASSSQVAMKAATDNARPDQRRWSSQVTVWANIRIGGAAAV
jgi:F0F1-type ATP synthase gamma subunit